MTVGVFANCTFCLKVKHLPRQQKKKLQTDIKENGGNSSFLLHPQCTHVILENVNALSQSQLNYIQKNHIHIASPDFIWESIKDGRLLDVKNYDPNKSPDSTQPSCQEASSSEVKTDALSLDNSTETENAEELTKFYTENVEIPHFPQEFEVAKYNTLEKVGTDGRQETAVVELQCSQDPGDPAFRISAHFLVAGGTQTRRQLSVKPTSADASECYGNYIEELKKQGFLLREHFSPEATQLASEKLQALLLEEVIHSSAVSREVSDLVEMMWAEALGHLEHTLLASVNSISLNDVSKAEGILLLAKAALKNGEPEEQLQKMMREFYRLIPHRGTTAEDVNLRLLATKEDLCQLIRDMVNVCETNLFKPNPPSLAKYRALRCKIEHVEQDTEEFFRVRNEVLQSNRSQSAVDILQIFRVGRVSETTEFVRQLGNVKPLLHGSAVRSFVGILSRGLLLPKVVEDRGVKRTDIGSLGSGIYFSDSLSTSTKYSHPGETDGTRLLAVCDVALGRCVDLHRKDFSLTEAPPGYDSVHGVQGTATVTTDFEDDEFVVYKTNQVKMKYIIKFCLPGDEIKDFHPCDNTELEEYKPEASNFSKVEDYQLPDSSPASSVKPGLQDTSGSPVPLEDVHIKGKIIDLVAQVIVFQTYTNQSHVPIEAKYIFPLDDKAAVCGFEAFINGKHIVGEIKEKEAAHREYREAVREGHGAYLMDQDAPDVFTVSVGNLPPKAKVLIKITYITELSIQGTVAVFFLPATVAPWQQDKALNENIQDTVEKICIKEIGTKQSFSLSMSIEMPYVIEFVSSDTHELKKKSTDCKAVISTVEGSSLDSNGFSLQVGLSDVYLPRMWVEKHPEKESEACMLVFQPDLGVALPDVAEESEVILCLDCSNSMEGATFLQAKQIALHALSLVGEKQTVNVVRFGSGYKELFSYPKCVTSSAVPTEFVMSASPTMGNTDFWKTLRYLSLLSPSRGVRNILLISDGHLQNEGLTLQLVKRHVRHTRLFSCGVGSTANRHVLRTLSQCGAGVFEYFNSKSKHNWKKQIEDQMARSRSPSCRSVSVKWQQLSPEAPEPLQAPARVRALFHGDRLLVYGLIPHCTQATLCALIQEKEFSTMVSTTELQKTTGTVIHKLTARALIRDHENGILHENETNHEMKKQILKSLIIQLSKENSLVTQFTSFVAVEKRDGDEAPFPNTPNTLELIAKEDVDFLPYVSWQEEQPDATMLQPLSASFEWHEEFQHKRLTKRKCKTSRVEVFEDFKALCLLEATSTVNFECRDVEKPLDLSQMDSCKHPGIRAPFSEAVSAPMAPASFAAAPSAAAPPRPLSSLPQSSLLCSAASPAASPPHPLSSLPQISPFGSPAAPPRPLSFLPQISPFGSPAAPPRPLSSLPQISPFGSPAAPPRPLSSLPQISPFGSPAAPPRPLSSLPQISPFGSAAAPPRPLSSLPQSSPFGSPAAPPRPLSFLPQISPFGSPAAPPRPLSFLPQSSLFGSPAHPKQFGPSKNDQDLEIGHRIDSYLKWGSPPRLPHFSSFTDLELSGGFFGSRLFDPPAAYEGPAAPHCAGISLELDSPQRRSLLFSPPAPPPPGPTKGSGFHLLPGSSPLHLPRSLAPLSTSHKQPIMHPVSLDIPATSVSSDSPQHAFLATLSSSETESFETESDKTVGFLESGFLKKVAKPDIIRRDFTASFLAQTDEEDILCKQSRRNSVPWTELFNLQTEDGFWKLTPELGFILNLDINILNNFLEQKGIRSLGVKGRERLLDLIATLLVLQLLRTTWEREGTAVTSLMKLDDASISRNFTWAFEEIKKASEWARRTEGQYPSMCQRLELGKDWDSATKQLLGIQPINATSPLQRVLNYSQG